MNLTEAFWPWLFAWLFKVMAVSPDALQDSGGTDCKEHPLLGGKGMKTQDQTLSKNSCGSSPEFEITSSHDLRTIILPDERTKT